MAANDTPLIKDPKYPRPKFRSPWKDLSAGPFARLMGNLVRAEGTVAGARANNETRLVNRFGRAHLDALYRASPDLATARDAMMARLATTGAGPSRLQQALEGQAFADLGMDGNLSAEDMRLADQSARTAFASRGLSMSNPAAVAEVMNRQQFRDARRQQRRGFAMDVEQMMGQREQQDRQFASTAFGQLFDTLDPYKRVFGAYSTAGGQSTTMGQRLQLHGDHLNYYRSQDDALMNDRLRRDEMQMQAMLQQQQMQADARSGMISGGLGAFGSILGAL